MPRVPDAVSYVGRNVSDCGYCASPDASVSDGAVAHGLSTKRYGELIDDGWRRSGTWIYKPAIDVSCCAQHTIRVSVDAFRPSKKQRQVLRRLDAYLRRERDEGSDGGDEDGARAARKLEITTARSTFVREEFELWKRYQAAVHGDEASELKEASFRRFLVDSPFVEDETPNETSAPSIGLGAFHQQYRIDGKLVAVGVVDILPKGLSSKYFFWDPEYAKLSLGKVSALKEIEFVADERRRRPEATREFEFYYMGYYIHDCQKMKYKADYAPSELRCSTTNRWVPVDDADVQKKLDAREHCRLSDEAALPRECCEPLKSMVGLALRGQLVSVTTLGDLPGLLESIGVNLGSSRGMRRFADEQAEWCERSGRAGMTIMNLVDIERNLLAYEDSDEVDEHSDDELAGIA